MTKKLSSNELNEIYSKAMECDEENFSEMRSNILLVAGQHYNSKLSKYVQNSRTDDAVQSDSKRIRVTKNFIPKIVRGYSQNILEKAPWVVPSPRNALEIQDKKAAELNKSVWDWMRDEYKLQQKRRSWCANMVELGEVHVKILFDPNEGEFVGYHQAMRPDTGEAEFEMIPDPMTGEMVPDQNQPKPDEERPVFKGAFIFKDILGFNLLRAPGIKKLEESPYLIERYMMDIKDLQIRYASDPEKVKMLEPSKDDEFVVFDADKQRYRTSKDQILVREHYYRPGLQYPRGYYFICVDNGVLEDGELPYGIFPIKSKSMDEVTTHPRGKSPIKVARNFQSEVNRASSQQAMQQLTLGDDKVVYQSGTKLAQGALLPGVRGISYQGNAPQILAGRDGAQFTPYIQASKQEMFEATDYAALLEDSKAGSGAVDVYSMLFMSAKMQKAYGQYIEKFSEFLVEVCQTALEIARIYMPEEMVIYAVGKSEAINIAEFKSTEKSCYKIKIEETTDSIDERIGRQLVFTTALQYLGKQLDQKQIGKILKNMPFMNNKDLFDDLTIDVDMVDNDILAIERGEQPKLSPYADNEYYEKRLTHRMKQADFKMLPSEIQAFYNQFLTLNINEIKRKMEAKQRAESGFIPVSGAMIATDMYIPAGEGKAPKRARVPYMALDWLLKEMEKQGMSLDKLEAMDPQSVAQMMANQQVVNQQAQVM